MPKRKSQSTVAEAPAKTTVPILPPALDLNEPAPPSSKRRSLPRRSSQRNTGSTNPNKNENVLDAPEALRASPDADEKDERMDLDQAGMDVEKQVKEEDESELSEPPAVDEPAPPAAVAKKGKAVSKKSETLKSSGVAAAPPTEPPKRATHKQRRGAGEDEDAAATSSARQPKKGAKKKVDNAVKTEEGDAVPSKQAKKVAPNATESQFLDPEADGDEEADEEDIQAALSRPPPVNSDYLPLPWKGRLGYVRVTSCQIIAAPLTFTRLVFVPIFVSQIHQYSVRGLVALLPFSKIAIRLPTQMLHLTPPKTDRIKRSQRTFLVGRSLWRVSARLTQRTL